MVVKNKSMWNKEYMFETKTWLIDDVLDPSSDFWKYKNKYDIDNLLSRISPLQTKKLFKIPNEDPTLDQFSEFIDFFQNLSKKQVEEYVDFIEDNEIEIMSDQVWRMVDNQDKRELFNKDPNLFDSWWKTLHYSEVEYYMGRIVASKRLVEPKDVLKFIKKLHTITKEDKNRRSLKNYPLEAGKFLTVQLIGDKLAISSKDISKLENVKALLESRGNHFLEERYKISPDGDKIFTYLFITRDI